MSHGWLTTKCPCHPFPQQQRTKTYRSASTSTEPPHGAASVKPNPEPPHGAAGVRPSTEPPHSSAGVRPSTEPPHSSAGVRLSSVHSDPSICSSAMNPPSVKPPFVGNQGFDVVDAKNGNRVSLKKKQGSRPCSSVICTPPAASSSYKPPEPVCFRCDIAKRESGRHSIECKEKLGKAVVGFGDALVPCTFLVPSCPLPELPVVKQVPANASIDLIDLSEDRYSNFNPGYRSMSPPEEDAAVCSRNCCHHLSQAVMPIQRVFNEQTDLFYEDVAAPLHQWQAVSLDNLSSKMAADRKHSTFVRSSWAGGPTASPSPPPPPPPPKVRSDLGGFPCMNRSPQSPSFDEFSESRRQHMLRHHVDHQLSSTRSHVAPVTVLAHSSLLSVSSSPLPSEAVDKASSNPHFYWELEFTGAKGGGAIDLATNLLPKVQVRPQFVCNCRHASVASGSLIAVSGRVERTPSLQPAMRNPPAMVQRRPHKLPKESVPSDLKSKTGSSKNPRMNNSTSTEQSHECQNLRVSQGSALRMVAEEAEEKTCSNQRCPTPPRVLSPGLSLVTCEEIAHI